MRLRLLGVCVLILALATISAFTLIAAPASSTTDEALPTLSLARTYPGWKMASTPGFGNSQTVIASMAVFNSKLYVGTANDNGAGLWLSPDGATWTPITITGWTTATTEVTYLKAFGSYLYAGTFNMNGAEIWRSNGVTWERVVQGGFGNATNVSVSALGVLGSNLYAFVGNYVASTDAFSLKLWRSATGAGGSWQPVSMGDMSGVWPSVAVDVYSGYLYLGLSRGATESKAELWRSNNGTTWANVITGSQTMSNTHVLSLADFGGYLYVGLRNLQTGAQIWRSTTGASWTKVVSTGLGNPQNRGAYGLFVYNSKLYAVFANFNTGAEIWRSSDAISWENVAYRGWGDGGVRYVDYFDRSAVVFNNRLYVGTFDGPGGGEIWKKTITAFFTADTTTGTPPLTVHFANRSTGDFSTSLWTFGDGASSSQAAPTHIYTAIGTYTVTLTIGDGVDTDTITRTHYIATRYRLFAPLILSNY